MKIQSGVIVSKFISLNKQNNNVRILIIVLVMIKIMVHIANYNTYIDENVCVQIRLAAVPRKGEVLYLSEYLQQVLEDKAKSNLEIARNYAPEWFYYGSSGCGLRELKQENLKDLSFGDARYVDSVTFIANSDIIHISLTDYDPTEN
jgi:hypothetical protein